MNTKKSENTPGPWIVYAGNEGHPVIHSPVFERYAGGAIIGIAETKTVGEADIEQANARLIAAAPELLTALKRLKDQMINILLICEIPIRFAESFNSGQEQARAAIAKAEGRL